MKIAIVIYTQSGHTLQFAKAIEKRFNSSGYETELFYLRTSGPVTPKGDKFTIKNPPDISGFDAALFGSPVWAFKAAPVIMEYLLQLKNFKGKKALSFVCKGLPFTWTGGDQAIKAMNQELESSGCDVLPGVILQAFFKPNQKKIDEAVEKVFSNFTSNTQNPDSL
ncbi:MAG: flavodoxin family protein [Fibrobacter sp.]|nr:flavodoxin family protein [Fibrobacter sp.]